MSMRSHETEATELGVAYLDADGVAKYDDELRADGAALVIEDAGNLEAFVIYGNREEQRAFVARLMDAIRRTYLTMSEANNLADFAERHGQEHVPDADWWIDDDDIAWWMSDDSTSYDLTNGLPRSLSIEPS